MSEGRGEWDDEPSAEETEPVEFDGYGMESDLYNMVW